MGGDPNNPITGAMPTEGRMRLTPNVRPEVNPDMLRFGLALAGNPNSGLARYLQAATPVTRVGTSVNRYQAPQIGQSLAAMLAAQRAQQQQLGQYGPAFGANRGYGLLTDDLTGIGGNNG